jgi:glucose-6-phosphate isomerase
MVGRPTEQARQLGAERGFDASASGQFELPGNHSHSLLIMDAITPECLGALIAAYEHKTYFLAVLLGINPFDQWGVELGKVIAGQMQTVLSGGDSDVEMDPATLAAAEVWRAANAD